MPRYLYQFINTIHTRYQGTSTALMSKNDSACFLDQMLFFAIDVKTVCGPLPALLFYSSSKRSSKDRAPKHQGF